jgi:branched-chain amino acid transport system ATP-binding protein
MRVGHPTRPRLALREGQAVVEIEGIDVSYGGIRALRGATLSVAQGEIVALIGANGAGKTTTLKTIIGLLPLSAGSVRFAGQDQKGVPTEERVARGMSLVPEGRAIFPNLTVRENLELGAYLHKDAVAIRETIEDVVGLFPRLGERMRQEGGTLSGGEQQMLAIGRALMARPELLLLDEPSLGIAPVLVQQIFAAIRRIAEAGVSVLVVEQNTRVALSASRRAYVLKTGEIALSGESAVLAADPEIQRAYLGA